MKANYDEMLKNGVITKWEYENLILIKKKKKKNRIILWSIIGGLFILFCIMGHFSSTTSSSNSNSSTTERFLPKLSSFELQRNIEELKTSGLLEKIELGNYFYVNSLIWDQLNIDAKKGIAMCCADYAATRGNGDKDWCEIKDYMTGKKLAKIGVWGFETY